MAASTSLTFAVMFILLNLASSSDNNNSSRGDIIMFVFGDSNSDTGGAGGAYGGVSSKTDGRIFPQRRPISTRASDGRLIIDFMCEHVGTSYLNAYLDATRANFNNGVNFAVAGADTYTTIFHLGFQFNQFRRMMNRSLEPEAIGLVPKQGFTTGIYIIDIGQNDLSRIESSNNSISADQEIPIAIAKIKTLMTSLYQRGARKFWVHSTGPFGCLPFPQFRTQTNVTANIDRNGCFIGLNKLAQQYNTRLAMLCDELRGQWSDATIVYVDIYAIKYELIANYKSYGFEDPFTPCKQATGTCTKDQRYINWDGGHYTDAANGIVASKVVTGDYNTPTITFDVFSSSTPEQMSHLLLNTRNNV